MFHDLLVNEPLMTVILYGCTDHLKRSPIVVSFFNFLSPKELNFLVQKIPCNQF